MGSSENRGSTNPQEDSLLAALERIGFLEWRLEQLGAELASERVRLHEHRNLLAQASRREAEACETLRDLHNQVAQAREESARLEHRFIESEATRSKLEKGLGSVSIEKITHDYSKLLAQSKTLERQSNELAHAHEHISRLQAQLDRFFERLIQWQHAAAANDPDAIDLMELIADLRGENLRLEAANAAERRQTHVLAQALADADATEQLAEILGPVDEAIPAAMTIESIPPTPAAVLESSHHLHASEDGSIIEADIAEPVREGTGAPIRLADAIFALDCTDLDQASARDLLNSLTGPQPMSVPAELVELKSLAKNHAPTVLGAIAFEADTYEARIAAIRALTEIGGPVASLVLRHCMEAPDWRLRAVGAEGLLNAQKVPLQEAVDAFHRALADADPRVRRRAAVAAAGSSACTEDVLIIYLSDKDAQTRRALAVAVGERGEVKGLFALSRLLYDQDQQVRQTAARALERRLRLRLPNQLNTTERERRLAARTVRERLIEHKQPCSR